MSLFLALDHGLPFAAAAARGSVASVAAGSAYAVAFARADGGWPRSLLAASAAYIVVALAMGTVQVPAPLLALFVAAVLLVSGRLVPPPSRRGRATRPAPPWDLPMRVVIATALVLAITTIAPALGPYGSAAAASFPLFASILGVFAERVFGHDVATDVMRGLLAGLFGFTVFFLVIAVALEPLGYIAFALATAAIFAVQGASLVWLRRRDVTGAV